MNAFQKKILREAEKKDSRLILSLDMSLPIAFEEDQEVILEKAFEVCRPIKDLIAGIKINRSFVDAAGFLNTHILLKKLKLPSIADFKLADIDVISLWSSRHAFGAGFDAITAHGFVGHDVIQSVMKQFSDKGVILVVDMPHPGANDFIRPNTEALCQLASNLSVSGVEASGNNLGGIQQVRGYVGDDMQIFCSGFQTFGGAYGTALRSGADFEMVGRAIYMSRDPEETTIQIIEEMRQAGKKK